MNIGHHQLVRQQLRFGHDRRYVLSEYPQGRQAGRMQEQLQYTAVFEPAEEGGYIVTFPAIPGLATQGETLEEARSMAADCLRAYLQSLRKDGEPFPYEAPAAPITERLTIDLARA